MALIAEDHEELLRALLPAGPAWGDEFTAKLLEGLSQECGRLDERIEKLLQLEADPRTSSELLEEWERLLGLPDDCMAGVELSVADRQRLAWQKLTALGGQSRAYFIGLAETLGVPGVTIDEFAPFNCGSNCTEPLYSVADRFTWRVNVPTPLEAVRPMTCNDDCNDALQDYTPNLIECPIEERKPAHTTVIFSYQT
jgi:uncharacterized protein YmfQ (DUF2313 family)